MTYQLLADCIRSGQLSATQVADVMRDAIFSAWFKAKYADQ